MNDTHPTPRHRRFDLIVAGSCLASALITAVLNCASPVARTLLHGNRVSALLIGSDYEDRTRHSDTLMYISYDPQSRFLDVLSIPRDTQVSIPELRFARRVNEIFAYEFKNSGKDFNIASMALKGYVETMLSSGAVRALTIPNYITIDYASFKALIDAMGGIYVKVTEPMNYDDNWGHLHIHLQPGTYLMDGHTALLYVRYRGGANADQGRVLRQQIFIKDMMQRIKNPTVLWRFPKYTGVVLDGIHTNFSAWDMFSLFLEGIHMRWKNLRLSSLPGTVYGNLWKMNPTATQDVLELMQKPVPKRGAPLKARTAGTAPLDSHEVSTVEVWNASIHPNVARTVIQLLRDQGFDVVKFGNFSTRQQRTWVIDRSGHLRPAQDVADVLRTIAPEVVTRIDLSRQVDVSVILGNDSAILEPKRMGGRR